IENAETVSRPVAAGNRQTLEDIEHAEMIELMRILIDMHKALSSVWPEEGILTDGQWPIFILTIRYADRLEDLDRLSEALREYRFALQIASYGRISMHENSAATFEAEG